MQDQPALTDLEVPPIWWDRDRTVLRLEVANQSFGPACSHDLCDGPTHPRISRCCGFTYRWP